MSRITRISWGRTYNTGNYTSYRVDIEYALDDTDVAYDTMSAMARRLDELARKVLIERGVTEILEPGGKVAVLNLDAEEGEDDADEIPY